MRRTVYKSANLHFYLAIIGTVLLNMTDKEVTEGYCFSLIWRCYHWFPRQMTSEKRAQKFHTDDAYYPDLGSTRHQNGISALVS